MSGASGSAGSASPTSRATKRASGRTTTAGSPPRRTPGCIATSKAAGTSRPNTTRSGPTTAIEAGVALGVKLEQLYRVWKQLFVRYYATEEQVVALFDARGRGRNIELPRHQVVYFRDREDYNRSLASLGPTVGISAGVYVDQTRRAYFFADKEQDERTLLHEATHQLFHESRAVARNVGMEGQFLDRRGDRRVHGIASP